MQTFGDKKDSTVSFFPHNPSPLNFKRGLASLAVKLHSSVKRAKSWTVKETEGDPEDEKNEESGARRPRNVRKEEREGEKRAEGGGGRGSQVFAESAGAGAINLAGISELMNVIKIQPPAS